MMAIIGYIVLWKLHAWEKSGSQVSGQDAIHQTDCRIFLNFDFSKTI